MKCKNCGTEFSEGLFCPECGTKWIEENENIDNDAELKAHDILKQYESVDNEKKQIEEIGWNQDSDCCERARKRLEQLRNIENQNFKSEYAKTKILKMKSDLRDDYYEIEHNNYSMKTAIICGVIADLIGLFLICSFGIIGIVGGIFLLFGSINVYIGPIESKKRMKEIDDFLDNSNKQA